MTLWGQLPWDTALLPFVPILCEQSEWPSTRALENGLLLCTVCAVQQQPKPEKSSSNRILRSPGLTGCRAPSQNGPHTGLAGGLHKALLARPTVPSSLWKPALQGEEPVAQPPPADSPGPQGALLGIHGYRTAAVTGTEPPRCVLGTKEAQHRAAPQTHLEAIDMATTLCLTPGGSPAHQPPDDSTGGAGKSLWYHPACALSPKSLPSCPPWGATLQAWSGQQVPVRCLESSGDRKSSGPSAKKRPCVVSGVQATRQ